MDFFPFLFQETWQDVKMLRCHSVCGECCPALPRAPLPGLEQSQILFSAAELAA